MDNIYEELENIFQNFRWIDNIPEDQYLRDKICLEARAAMLLEANCATNSNYRFYLINDKSLSLFN